jgi:citrate lyase subunit beta/citryl-CoA lyase
MREIRSLLFVPGDSPRKYERARQSGADALILDLEDSVAGAAKPQARINVAQMLTQREERQKLFVRVNAFDTGMTLLDLAAVVGPADGIVLPKCHGAEDLRRLQHYLEALEVGDAGRSQPTTILPIVTEAAKSLFALDSYRGCSERLVGMIWGAEDLSADLGAFQKRDAAGYHSPYRLARDLCLIAASAAKVAAVDTVYTDIGDLEGLAAEAREARRDGFSAKAIIHPSHVAAVNSAFASSEEEIHWARQIVDAFAANPDSGALKLDGRMIDQPHLALAQKILARG